MNFSLRHLRYFLATADKRQISQAAAGLNVSQSTITTSLQQLEREVGVSLFRRLPSGVELTLEGARFLPHARNILEAVGLAQRARLSERAPLAGVVRIGVTATAAGYYLPRRLARFARAYPDIRLELMELSRVEIEIGLHDDRFDFAVVQAAQANGGDGRLGWETLLQSRRRLWASADHPLLAARSLELAEIARAPYVMLSADDEDRAAAGYWRLAGLNPQVMFTTGSIEAARNVIGEGLAIAILPDLLYRPFSLDGRRIEQRPLAESPPALELGLAWSLARTPEPAARELIAYLSRSAGGGS